MTRLVPRALSTLYTVAVRNSGANIPLAADKGSGGTDHSLQRRFKARPGSGSSHLDPPGMISSWKITELGSGNASGGLHDCPLDDDAGVDILPQRDEQLAGERDNRCLLETAAVLLDPVLKPQGECRSRLMAQPEPGRLDQRRSQPWIAGFRYPLVVVDRPALSRCRREARMAATCRRLSK